MTLFIYLFFYAEFVVVQAYLISLASITEVLILLLLEITFITTFIIPCVSKRCDVIGEIHDNSTELHTSKFVKSTHLQPTLERKFVG